VRKKNSPASRPRRPSPAGRRRLFLSLEALESRVVMTVSSNPVLAGYANVTFPESTVNATPQFLGNGVTVTDAGQSWAGGNLTVSGLLAEDRVDFPATGAVSRVGNAVQVNGVTVGTVGTATGQTGVGESLVVTFNDAATDATVQGVVRALTYQDVSTTPTATRNLTVLLTDATGARSLPEQVGPNYVQQTGAADPLPGTNLGTHANPALADLHGAGNLDLVIGRDDGTLTYFRNTGTATAPAYVQQTGAANPFNGINVGTSASPALGDFNGDGLIDLAVGNSSGTVQYFRNTGTATAPAYVQEAGSANPFDGVQVGGYSRLTVADVNNDGLLDLAVGQTNGTVSYYRNTGTKTVPAYVQQTGAANPFNGFSVPNYSTPALGDVNNDGLVDLLIGTDNTVLYYRNTGTAAAPAFTAQTGAANPFTGIDFGTSAHPALVDVNGDGLTDLAVGNLFGDMALVEKDRFSLQLTVTPNQPPVLTGSGTPVTVRGGGPAVAVDPNLTVSDPDGPNLTSASVSLGTNFNPAEDRLLFTTRNGINGAYDTGTGILTLTGSATAAQYQDALRSVEYQNLNGTSASTAPRAVSFSIAPGAYNPANGHFYEFVNAPGMSWTSAKAAADARSVFGVKGYLATLTSQPENVFAFSKAQATGWIGASDAPVNGEWRWADGPENGQQFWQGDVNGAPVAGRFSDWGPSQPDNAGNVEDYAQFVSNGTWNDLSNNASIQGYVVEYGGSDGDPTLRVTSQATVNVVSVTATPTVTSPSTPQLVNTPTTAVQGTAAAGSLVRVYNDANNNGVIDAGDAVVGSQQLADGATSYAVDATLTRDATNHLLVTATRAPANESDPAGVPAITEDSTAPAAPVVTSPSAPTTVNAATAVVSGTAVAGSLVRVYNDANGNGAIDPGDAVVGSQQLADGATNYSVTAPLTPDAANHFLVAAADAAGNVSAPAVVPTVTETAPEHGTVFLDVNANGTLDAGEPGLAGRVVFGDQNHDGVLGDGEPTATTDADGHFMFPGVGAGTADVIEATGRDTYARHVVGQVRTNADGSVTLGVVPISPVAPAPVVPSPFAGGAAADAASAYVRSLYNAVLGRTGDSGEVAGWVSRLNGGDSRQQVAEGFVNSPEHRTEEVRVYYDKFLHRAPDPLSQHWVDAFQAGRSEQDVAGAILNSPEYQSAHTDPGLFARDLYLDVLGRQSEDSGSPTWQASMMSGRSREQVVADFVGSPEAKQQVVDGLYAAYLHRRPDPASSRWTDELNAPGGSVSDVEAGILSSDEFNEAARAGGR